MPPRGKTRKSRPANKPFSSPFTRAFIREFIRNPKGSWPSQDHNELAIANDLETFSAVLLRGAVTCLAVEQVEHQSRGPVSTASVLAFLRDFEEQGRMPKPKEGVPAPTSRQWPVSQAAEPLAKELKVTFRAYRCAEVRSIMRGLLQAVASFRKIGDGGGGGESTKLPPT